LLNGVATVNLKRHSTYDRLPAAVSLCAHDVLCYGVLCCAVQRMVRSIFSTGQVPLLEGAQNQSLSNSREFIIR
jgi:hypothetical protein